MHGIHKRVEDNEAGRYMRLCRILVYALLFLSVCLQSDVLQAQNKSRVDLTYCRGTFFGKDNNIGYLLDVVSDAQGNVYGTGWCTSIQTTPGVYAEGNAGRRDVMVFKMDPTLSTVLWATYIGGASDDAGGSIWLNAAGEVIVSGYTFSANFPVINDVGKQYLQSEFSNAFVLKLSADGKQLIYSSVLGRILVQERGLEDASRGAVSCINAQGEVYTAAQSVGGAYAMTTNAYSRFFGGQVDIVVSKVSATGAIVYGSFYGGRFIERPTEICYAQGRLYVSGVTNSDNLPIRYGKIVDASDALVLMFREDANGLQAVRCTIFGSGALDVASTVTFDNVRNRLLVSGTAFGSNMDVTTALLSGHSTGGYVTSFDPEVQTQGFITILGFRVVPRALELNFDGTIYIGGYVTHNGVAPVTQNAFQSTPQGNFDAVLLVLDPTASSLLYGTYLCGTAEDYASVSVCFYRQGCFMRVFVGLTTHSLNFPTTSDSFLDKKLNGNEDQPVIVMFSSLDDMKLHQDIKICERELSISLGTACSPISIVWDFGDGTRDSSRTTVKHVYKQSGTYSVRVRLTYLEPDTILIVREIPMTGPLPVDAGLDEIVCKGNTRKQLRASGALSYQWTPTSLYDNANSASPYVQPTRTTTYYVRGTDINGCTSTDSVTLYVNETQTLITPDTSVCAGHPLIIRVTGGMHIQWVPDSSLRVITPNDAEVRPKRTTTYYVYVTNGVCTDTDSVVVKLKPSPQLRMPTPQVVCPGEASLLRAVLFPLNGSDTSGARYRWSPDIELDNPNASQTIMHATQNRWYYLDVESVAGCVFRDSVFVTMRRAKTLRVIADTGMCAGSELRLWAQGADAYSWSPAEGLSDSSIASPLCTVAHSQVYTLISNFGPCVDTHRVVVQVHDKPQIQVMEDTTICIGSPVQLRLQGAIGPYAYEWWPTEGLETTPIAPEVRARPTRSMTYYLQARSSAYCSTIDSVQVKVDKELSVDAGPDQSHCIGETATITLASDLDTTIHYTLQPAVAVFDAQKRSFQFDVKQEGEYIVRAQRGSCSAEDTLSIRFKQAVDLPQLLLQQSICDGQRAHIRLVAQDPNTKVQWRRASDADPLLDAPDSTEVWSVPLFADTQFELHVSNSSSCDRDTTILVRVFPPPQVISAEPVQGCVGDSVAANIRCDQPVRVKWVPSEGLSSDTVLQPTVYLQGDKEYSVELVNEAGCTSTQRFQTKIVNTQNIELWVDSVETVVGNSFSIQVSARSTTATQMDRDLLLRVPASAFVNESVFAERLVDRTRYIELPTKGLPINSSGVVLASVPGIALLYGIEAAPLELQIDSLDQHLPGSCTDYHLRSAKLLSRSCLGGAQGIVLREVLRAALNPQPVQDWAALSFSAKQGSTVQLKMLDALGRCVYSNKLIADGSEQRHQISMAGLGSGMYRLELINGDQFQEISIIRIE